MAEIIRINDNSWRIEDGFVRCFLLTGSSSALLIDTGMTLKDARKIAEGLTALPIQLLNTHADPDHIGGNAAFESCYMHPAEEPCYRAFGGSCNVIPLGDGETIDLGGRPLEVIWLPGHTPGSIALLDVDARVLISGDSVQSDNIFMFGPRRNIRNYIKSMEKLSLMKGRFSEVWPSHGAFPAQPGLVDQLIEGANTIVSGKAEGKETEHRGSRVMLYTFPYAGFICDMPEETDK